MPTSEKVNVVHVGLVGLKRSKLQHMWLMGYLWLK